MIGNRIRNEWIDFFFSHGSALGRDWGFEEFAFLAFPLVISRRRKLRIPDWVLGRPLTASLQSACGLAYDYHDLSCTPFLHAGWSFGYVGVLTIALDSTEFVEADADLISDTMTR